MPSPAISNAIAFLTLPLHALYPLSTITKLRLLLEANLSHCTPFLPLDPHDIPPRPIYAACLASGIQWSKWISSFGNQHMDLYIHPHRVTVYASGTLITIWEDRSISGRHRADNYKTLAQKLIEDEDEGDEILAMLEARLSIPITAPTPIVSSFSIPPRVPSPLSRSSSRTSYSSTSEGISSAPRAFPPSPKKTVISRRERARLARVFIDKSKKEVTPYDGGRTGVLTGGVMLGGRSPAAVPLSSSITSEHSCI